MCAPYHTTRQASCLPCRLPGAPPILQPTLEFALAYERGISVARPTATTAQTQPVPCTAYLRMHATRSHHPYLPRPGAPRSQQLISWHRLERLLPHARVPQSVRCIAPRSTSYRQHSHRRLEGSGMNHSNSCVFSWAQSSGTLQFCTSFRAAPPHPICSLASTFRAMMTKHALLAKENEVAPPATLCFKPDILHELSGCQQCRTARNSRSDAAASGGQAS